MESDEAATAKIDELYSALGTGPNGLTDEEVSSRLRKYGPNVFPQVKKRGVAKKVVFQLKNAFNLLLFIAASLSFLSGYLYNDPGSIQMAFAIAAVIVINTAFSLFQEYRAERAAQVISKLVPAKAKVVRGSQLREVEVSEVVPGDIVSLDEGDRLPADLRLTSAFEVSVDNSILTGESEPQRRFVDMTPGMTVNSPTDYHNILFAGTTLATGVARGVVLSTGRETQFGSVVALSSEIEESPSPLQKDIDYTARVSFIIAIAVSALFFLVSVTLVGLTVVEGILSGIGVMLSLVPEGFQLTISLSLALMSQKMAKRNVVVKRLSSIEAAGSMNVLCLDKTGTVTSGEMMVQRLWATGKVFDVTGDGYSPEGFITVDGRKTNTDEKPHILSLLEVAAYCSNAKLIAPTDRISRWTILGDPTDGAFLVFAGKGDFNVVLEMAQNPRVDLIPFSSERRMMTTLHRSNNGDVKSYTKGSPQEVLSRCTSIFHENELTPLSEELESRVREQITSFASAGYRVLALASKPLPSWVASSGVEPDRDMTFLGLAALQDLPRPKTEEAVRDARRAGIKVIMMTGDQELTAEMISRKVGIVTRPGHETISGKELSGMSDEELSQALDGEEIVFARTTPEHKLRVVKALTSKGSIVGVTGDGVNDSPALIEADVGIAIGAGGTDVARESADLVLLDNDLTSIVEAVRLGRATYNNLRKFVYFIYTQNWAELLAFIVFVILRTPLPLLVIQELAIDLFLEAVPSLALIMEPPEADVMDKLPRSRGERLINLAVLTRAGVIGMVVGAGAVLVAFSIWARGEWFLGSSSVADPRIYAAGTTAVVTGIVAGQLGNLFASRTSSKSAFSLNILRNRWIFIGVAAQFAVLLSLVYLPPLQSVFGTAPLEPISWALLFLIAPMVLFLEEGRKYLAKILHVR